VVALAGVAAVALAEVAAAALLDDDEELDEHPVKASVAESPNAPMRTASRRPRLIVEIGFIYASC
jgi:hypothetical protein